MRVDTYVYEFSFTLRFFFFFIKEDNTGGVTFVLL